MKKDKINDSWALGCKVHIKFYYNYNICKYRTESDIKFNCSSLS